MEIMRDETPVRHDLVTSALKKVPISPLNMTGVTLMTLNNTNCSSFTLPTVEEFFKATGFYGLVLTTAGSILVLLTLTIFLDILYFTLRTAPSKTKSHIAYITAIYPIVSAACLTAVIVPRSYLVAEAVTQIVLMTTMYQLFCLFMAYCGGEEVLISEMEEKRLNLMVGPCCCWPCCSALPTFSVQKKSIKSIKLLVLQLPLVQSTVYFIILVLWAESEDLYQRNYLYLQPIVVTSIFSGVWGMTMMLKLLYETSNSDFDLTRKFVVLQMVLVFSKVQGFTTRSLVWFDWLPCHLPMTPQEYANLIHNTLMVIEMSILALLTRHLYKKTIKSNDNKNLRQCIDNLGYI